MEFIEWLVTSADDITAGAILVAIIFAVVFGVQQPSERYDGEGNLLADRWGRPWWVPGWTYRQCITMQRAQKTEIDGYVSDLKKRVEELEAAQSTRRRART